MLGDKDRIAIASPPKRCILGRARVQMLPFSYQIYALVLPTMHHVWNTSEIVLKTESSSIRYF